MAQVIEHLPSRNEALSLNPSANNNKKTKPKQKTSFGNLQEIFSGP
jgi:hypothetical protein